MDDGAGSRAWQVDDASRWEDGGDAGAGSPADREARDSRFPDRGLADPLAALAFAAGQGQAEAAERLLAALRPRLTRIALAVGAPPDDVPDLVQETLVAAHRRGD